MGLLDDAIREHLDLKRRRGADPTEVERAEREALGPVRRDPFEAAEDEPQPELAGSEPGAYDQAEDVGYEEYEPEPANGAHALAEEEPFAEDEPSAGDERGAAADEGFLEEEPFAEGEPFADERSFPAPHPAQGGVGEETAEYDVEETFEPEGAPPSEPPAYEEPEHQHEDLPHEHGSVPREHEDHPHGEEDVLEETPEFLQDAPEHDRLWFEQRPPKDFDFDG